MDQPKLYISAKHANTNVNKENLDYANSELYNYQIP